jgi:integrase
MAAEASRGCSSRRRFLGDDRKAREITSDALTAYAAHRFDEKSKPSTVNYELAVLRRFKLAKRAGKVASWPLGAYASRRQARKGFFERDQYDAVLKNLPEFIRPVAAVGVHHWLAHQERVTHSPVAPH